MEDSGEEWIIEEYCAYSGEDESESKRSWFSKGLSLGKKVVMTGVVISTAPLVLPPLVAVSAIGFAFSVPFGVVFASYTCAEKFMSKLLPMPTSAKMLEYGPLLDDENFGMKEEEKRQTEGIREDVDKSIELEEGEDVLPEKSENSLKNIEEEGHEEDVGEYLEGEDERSLGGVNVKIQSQGEKVEKEPWIRESKNEESPHVVKRVVVVLPEQEGTAAVVQKTDGLVLVGREVRGGTGSAGKETQNAATVAPKEETTGLLEKVRDEGHSGEHIKKNKKKNKLRLKKSHGVGEKEKAESVGTKETEKPSKVGNEKLNALVTEIDKSDAKKEGEIVLEKEKGNVAAEGVIIKNTEVDDGRSAQVTGKPVGYQSNGNHAKENSEIRDENYKERTAKEHAETREDPAKSGFPASKHGILSKEEAEIPSSGVSS